MKVVQVFQTEDGKNFNDRTEARRHEVTIEAFNALKALLASSMATGRPEAVLKQMLIVSGEVQPILASFRKKWPKDAAKVESFPEQKQEKEAA